MYLLPGWMKHRLKAIHCNQAISPKQIGDVIIDPYPASRRDNHKITSRLVATLMPTSPLFYLRLCQSRKLVHFPRSASIRSFHSSIIPRYSIGKMPSSKGKPTDPKLREKVKEDVKNETNKDGGGKGQWSAWKVNFPFSLFHPSVLEKFQLLTCVPRPL